MFRFATDEDMAGAVVHALLRRQHLGYDFVRTLDEGLAGWDDPAVLAWAAKESRILISRDRNTMTDAAYERLRSGLEMPGLLLLREHSKLGEITESVEMIVHCTEPKDWRQVIEFIPLRLSRGFQLP